MPGKKQRVSVVRISRQIPNQSNLNELQEETEPDPSTIHLKPSELQRLDETSPPNKKEQNVIRKEDVQLSTKHFLDVPQTKSDVFTLEIPQVSNRKSGDRNLQNATSPRSSFPIQQQPTRTDTWLKRPSNHAIRPELNWKATGKWSHQLCALLEDPNMSCYACFCWCCFRHEISTMMGEHWCLWFLDCAPLMHLRTKFRQQYAIQGSIAEDCCLSACCPLCVAIQLANEGRDHGHRIFS